MSMESNPAGEPNNALAPSLSRDRSRERLVKVAVAENPMTAELIRQSLTEVGIPCLVKNTDPLGVVYTALTGSFALQVFVLEGDEQAALAILAQAEDAPAVPPSLPRRRRYRRRSR